MFDIKEMLRIIKSTPGNDCTTEDILGFSFDPLIREYNLFNNKGKHLQFDSTRASKVLNGHELLYSRLCNTTNKKNCKDILYKNKGIIIHNLYSDIDFDDMMKKIIDSINADDSFDINLKNKINNELSYEDVYVELLYYCMKVDYNRYKIAETKLEYSPADDLEVDYSIIDIMIRKMVSYKRVDHVTKSHSKTYKLQDKMKRNQLNLVLQMRIENSYDDYDYVMEVIEDLKTENLSIDRDLFSYYKDTYYNVLEEVLNDDITENNILEKSSLIFNKVNEEVYNEIFKDGIGKLTIEEAKINLFAITVAVFYECKFLLPMEDEEI